MKNCISIGILHSVLYSQEWTYKLEIFHYHAYISYLHVPCLKRSFKKNIIILLLDFLIQRFKGKLATFFLGQQKLQRLKWNADWFIEDILLRYHKIIRFWCPKNIGYKKKFTFVCVSHDQTLGSPFNYHSE